MTEKRSSQEKHSHGPLAEILPDEKAQDMAAFYKALGDPTRVRILHLLSQREHCVEEIAEHLHATMSGISHQLRSLREARLVRNRRDGKHVFYTLDDDHVRVLLEQGFEHIDHR